GEAGSGLATTPSRFTGARPLDLDTCLPDLDPERLNGGIKQIDPTGEFNGCAGGAAGTFHFFNFNPFNVFQTPFKRYNIYGQANYEISDAVEVYARGMFSKNQVKTIIAPSGSFTAGVTINLNNPLLPDLLRQQFCAFNTAPINPDTGVPDVYTPRFTPAECDAAAAAVDQDDPDYREVTVNLSRRTPEVGPRISDYRTTIFDYRMGLRGPLTSTVDWDVAGSYGESENVQEIQNYTLQSRFRQGSLANLDPVTGLPVCQDPSNGCVPLDIFGPEGSLTPEMADFLSENSTSRNKATLGQLRGIISGDAGFALPWATQPIGFAVGTEFRKYKASQASDTLAKTAGELGGAGGAAPDIDGGYSVYEGYGELIAPIVEDKEFFESLTLETGIRYSKYEIDGAGGNSTWTWKAGGSWEPGYGVKIRGNYSKAVRAPNIGELFTPLTVGLTNLGQDPCAGSAPVANANLRAICLAQGAPAGSIGSIEDPAVGQANAVFGGNLDLKPETARTWTLGMVFVPEFLPRFSMSVDYYHIRVKDVIGTALPGDAIQACFGDDPGNPPAGAATNPACLVIRRDPISGELSGDPATTPGLFLATTNLGELFTDGVDLIMNYKTDVGFGDLAWSFVGNWTNNSEFNANVDSSDSFFRECAGYYSVNCSFTGSIQPKLQFSQRATLTVGKVDFSVLWRWIDAMKLEPRQIEADNAAADAANRDDNGDLLPLDDQGCPDFLGEDPGGCVIDEEFRKIPSEHYFDLSVRFNATDNMTFTAVVQNLFDNQPKVVGNTIGSTSFNSGNVFPATYDALGRRYGVSAKLKF
ncbi:MAG TPA: TonB-dependent receptor, partial [Sphingomicrobium sp.]|nr:TonB-dependent receptor [Sphingomicrobium sp.]